MIAIYCASKRVLQTQTHMGEGKRERKREREREREMHISEGKERGRYILK